MSAGRVETASTNPRHAVLKTSSRFLNFARALIVLPKRAVSLQKLIRLFQKLISRYMTRNYRCDDLLIRFRRTVAIPFCTTPWCAGEPRRQRRLNLPSTSLLPIFASNRATPSP